MINFNESMVFQGLGFLDHFFAGEMQQIINPKDLLISPIFKIPVDIIKNKRKNWDLS